LPYSYLVIGDSGKPTLIYYQPADYWHTPPADPEGFWAEHFDIKVIRDTNTALEFLPQDSEKVAWLGENNSLSATYSKAQKNPKGLLSAIYWQRAYKSDYEIECIAEANRQAAGAHRAAEAAFRAGESELAIHLAYLKASGRLEHQMPYGNIVALNEHAAVLHYTECEAEVPQTLRSFLIDAGLTVNGYHSDITRTYAADESEFAELIQAMDGMQQALIASIKTDQSYVDLHISAHLEIAKILQQFDIVRMTPESMVESGVSNVFFPHGLGHLIGLQVHDIGGHFADEFGNIEPPPELHPFLRCTRQMEPGMVFTIEPGLYFIDMLLDKLKAGERQTAINWSKVEALKPYGGIRIEDNILVQAGNRVRNLTREAFAQFSA